MARLIIKRRKREKDFEKWVVKTLTAIHRQGVNIMATVDELNAKMDAIPPVLDAIEADTNGLKAQIQTLSDQIAAGTPVSQAQLDALVVKADGIVNRVQSIDAEVP
jgi:cell division protein FtsB